MRYNWARADRGEAVTLITATEDIGRLSGLNCVKQEMAMACTAAWEAASSFAAGAIGASV